MRADIRFVFIRPIIFISQIAIVLFDCIKVPFPAFRVSGINQRASLILRRSVNGIPPGVFHEPALLFQEFIIITFLHKPRPAGYHCLIAHFLKLPVHLCTVGPELRIQAQISQNLPMEPVHYKNIAGIALLLIFGCNRQKLLLGSVSLLTLNESQPSSRRQGRRSAKASVAPVNIIRFLSRYQKEGNRFPHLGLPNRVALHTGRSLHPGSIIKDNPIFFIRNKEGHGNDFTALMAVIMPQDLLPAAQIQTAVLMLSQAKIFLILRSGKNNPDMEGFFAQDNCRFQTAV